MTSVISDQLTSFSDSISKFFSYFKEDRISKKEMFAVALTVGTVALAALFIFKTIWERTVQTIKLFFCITAIASLSLIEKREPKQET